MTTWCIGPSQRETAVPKSGQFFTNIQRVMCNVRLTTNQFQKFETDFVSRPTLGVGLFCVIVILLHCTFLQYLCASVLLCKAFFYNNKNGIGPSGVASWYTCHPSTRHECASTSQLLLYHFKQCNLLFRCLGFFLLIQMASSTPLIDLQDGNSLYKLPIGNNTITLIYEKQGIILYKSELNDHRQMIEISKLLDLTELAVTNSMAAYSMNQNPKLNDKFYLVNAHEFFISKSEDTLPNCYTLCAEHSSHLISSYNELVELKSIYNGQTWLDCKTQTKVNDDDQYIYSVTFDDKNIYPNNDLTDTPVVLQTLSDHRTIQIEKIASEYKYYNGQTSEYWTTYALKLWCAINGNNVFIKLPLSSTTLPNSDYKMKCVCARHKTHSKQVYHEFDQQKKYFNLYQSKLNISIEPIRQVTGDVMKILHPEFQTENEFQSSFEAFMPTMASVKPLSIHNTEKSSNLVISSAVSFMATKIGLPFLKLAFIHFLESQAKKIGGQIIQYRFNKSIDLPVETRLVGLTSTANKFQYIIEYPQINTFQLDGNLDVSNYSLQLENLNIANKEVRAFLNQKAAALLFPMAIRDISCNIDKDLPILLKIKKSKSFFIFTYTVGCHVQPSITHYTMVALPHLLQGDNLFAIQVPHRFSASSFNYQFKEGDTQDLRSCVTDILTNKISNHCLLHNFAYANIQSLLEEQTFVLIYISNLNDADTSHVQIDCPSRELYTNVLTTAVAVYKISPSCAIGLQIKSGSIVRPGNSSYVGHVETPVLLFQYDIQERWTSTKVNTLIISCTAASVALLLMILLILYYFICVKNVTKITVEKLTPPPDLDIDSETSQNTIMNFSVPLDKKITFKKGITVI